jgi:hypothetical protein
MGEIELRNPPETLSEVPTQGARVEAGATPGVRHPSAGNARERNTPGQWRASLHASGAGEGAILNGGFRGVGGHSGTAWDLYPTNQIQLPTIHKA